MTRNGKILAGAAVVLTLGSAAALANRHGGWHHKGPHGWGGAQGMMGLAGPLCRGNPAEKADLMMVRLQYKVNPTDAQKPTFEELKTAVKSAALKVAASCPAKSDRSANVNDGGNEGVDSVDGGATPVKDITQRLAETEAQLAAALEGVKTIRPAADKFYASLDDAQKKALSEIGMGKRGKWGPHRERWDDRGGDREAPQRSLSPDDGSPENEGKL